MKPKIVFFDCDGVLINYNTWVKMLRLIHFPRKENDRLWRQFYLGKITFGSWVDIQSKYFKKYFTQEIYQKEIVDKVKINHEASKIVAYLKSKKIPVAIISSGEQDYVEAVAKKLKIKLFRVNTYFRFDKNGKFVRMDFNSEDQIAKVDQVKEICQQFDCSPEETFFVGDSDNDLSAFKLTKHGLLYKNKKERFIKAAWKVIGDLNEIKKLIS